MQVVEGSCSVLRTVGVIPARMNETCLIVSHFLTCFPRYSHPSSLEGEFDAESAWSP